MPRYRAKAALHARVSGTVEAARYIKAGEVFESDDGPGRNWHPMDDAAAAAVVAKFGVVLPDRAETFGLGGPATAARAAGQWPPRLGDWTPRRS